MVMTTTRLRSTDTCDEKAPSTEEKMPPSLSSSSSSLQNGLVPHSAENVGRTNGYTLTGNRHINVSNDIRIVFYQNQRKIKKYQKSVLSNSRFLDRALLCVFILSSTWSIT